MDNYRNYEDNNDVKLLYKKMNSEQTYYKKLKLSSLLKYNQEIDVEDAIYCLNKVVDSSDPDAKFEQIYHGYQTAESIRYNFFDNNNKLKDIYIPDLFDEEEFDELPSEMKKKFDTTIDKLYVNIKSWSWLILLGLIHDLGKVLVLPEFGCFPEHFSVGDIYPLGCKFQESNIYYKEEYFKKSIDYENEMYRTDDGVYRKNCGFNNVEMTMSHDYYFANVLKKSFTLLPDEAIYIIRFHSFYPWHTPHNKIRGYTNLANIRDWINLPLLKLFQKNDLYSKSTILPDVEKLEDYYKKLIKRYIPFALHF